MARVIVLFGPPAIGKSFALAGEKKKYKNSQFVNIDKDILNKYFFSPSLKKMGINSPFDIIWRTTSHLVELLTSEFQVVLEQKGTPNEKDVVVFLQGVTLGGIEEDIQKLLNAGYSMEFVLLTVENPAILHKRIHARAMDSDFVGAPPMSEERLKELTFSCNASFLKIIMNLNDIKIDDNEFYEALRKYKADITYRVELTRTRQHGLDISDLTDLSLESQLSMDIYSPKEIDIQSDSVVLVKTSQTVKEPRILATG